MAAGHLAPAPRRGHLRGRGRRRRPDYLRAAQESLLQDELRSWPTVATGITVEQVAEVRPDVLGTYRRPWPERRTGLPAHRPQIGGSSSTRSSSTTVARWSRRARSSTARAPRGAVRLRQGRCPVEAGEAIIIAASALVVERGVGQDLRLGPIPPVLRGGNTPPIDPLTLRVVGVYDALDPGGPYWHSRGYVADQTGQPSEGTRVDAVITPAATFGQLVPGARSGRGRPRPRPRPGPPGRPAAPRAGADRLQQRLDERAPDAHVTTFLGNVLVPPPSTAGPHSAGGVRHRPARRARLVRALHGDGQRQLGTCRRGRPGQAARVPASAPSSRSACSRSCCCWRPPSCSASSPDGPASAWWPRPALPGTPVEVPPAALAGAGWRSPARSPPPSSGARVLRRSVPELARRATAGRPGRRQLLGEVALSPPGPADPAAAGRRLRARAAGRLPPPRCSCPAWSP